jgi:hypothetical protein
MSDEDNAGLNKPVGDDAEGNEAPSAETLTPNPIGSSSAGETHPTTADQAVPTSPSGDGQKKSTLCLGPSASTTKIRMIR